MEALVKNIKQKPVTRGYFEKTQYNKNMWQTYVEYKEEAISIAKKTNITYTEYLLSKKDIEFILTSFTALWNATLNYGELHRQAKGKIIKVIKKHKTVSISINGINILSDLNIKDSKKFYAMLKELVTFGKTNKLN